MVRQRFQISRPKPFRNERSVLLVAAEGKTERQYCNLFLKEVYIKSRDVRLKCINNGKKSDPSHVLNCVKRAAKEETGAPYEAWVIIDRDHWTDDQIIALQKWAESAEENNLAISNPKIEYWFALHFEDGSKIKDCDQTLKRCWPQFTKQLKGWETHLTTRNTDKAIASAKQKHPETRPSWPMDENNSTVYRLVESIKKKPSRSSS